MAWSPAFIEFLSLAGPLIFCGFLVTTASSGLAIIHDKSVKALSPVPFIALFSSCFLWSVYGLMKDDNTILLPNIAGTIVSGACVGIYDMYCSKLAWEAHGVSLFVLLLTFHLYQSNDVVTMGSAGCIMSVLVTAAPLATISSVVSDRSTASLPPFQTILAMFFNALSWTLYGAIVAEDLNVWAPNLLGMCISLLLLSLFVVYPTNAKGQSARSPRLQETVRLLV
jgi:uncharacterized protein with PQ loop repeat